MVKDISDLSEKDKKKVIKKLEKKGKGIKTIEDSFKEIEDLKDDAIDSMRDEAVKGGEKNWSKAEKILDALKDKEKRLENYGWKDEKTKNSIKWLEKYLKMLKGRENGIDFGFGVTFNDCDSLGKIMKKVNEKTHDYESSMDIARIMNAICKVKKAQQYLKGTTKE
ncbi:MAG: hypothetical protein R6U26_00865 [Candidatus Undinarchaeales archaeon]